MSMSFLGTECTEHEDQDYTHDKWYTFSDKTGGDLEVHCRIETGLKQ